MADLHTNILILSTPRTGSNLLCECMTQAHVFGKVDGFFAGSGVQLKDLFAGKAEEWLNDHQHEGVHATKASLDYFDMIGQHTGPAILDRFMKRFTHYIVLGRRDTEAQAVSFYFARFTKRWHSKSKSNEPDPVYDYWRILWYKTFVEGLEHRAKLFAAGTGRPVIDLYYEDIVLDLTTTINDIATWSDLHLDQDFKALPSFQKQNNPSKQQYIIRFNLEYGERYASSQ